MEKLVQFEAAYDKRDPDPSKNCGVHGVNIRFILRGKEGAVQFLIFTNWMLPQVQRERDSEPLTRFPYMFHKPMASDVGYHSPKPVHGNDNPVSENCPILGGVPCYSESSGLYAEEVFDRLLKEGDAGVWDELKSYYKDIFGGGKQ